MLIEIAPPRYPADWVEVTIGVNDLTIEDIAEFLSRHANRKRIYLFFEVSQAVSTKHRRSVRIVSHLNECSWSGDADEHNDIRNIWLNEFIEVIKDIVNYLDQDEAYIYMHDPNGTTKSAVLKRHN